MSPAAPPESESPRCPRAACGNHRVQRRLTGEMIVGLVERNASEIGEARDNTGGELRMRPHAGAHCGAPQGKLDQRAQRLVAAAASALDLACVSEELLSEAD